jgi:hypothetical protein
VSLLSTSASNLFRIFPQIGGVAMIGWFISSNSRLLPGQNGHFSYTVDIQTLYMYFVHTKAQSPEVSIKQMRGESVAKDEETANSKGKQRGDGIVIIYKQNTQRLYITHTHTEGASKKEHAHIHYPPPPRRPRPDRPFHPLSPTRSASGPLGKPICPGPPP